MRWTLLLVLVAVTQEPALATPIEARTEPESLTISKAIERAMAASPDLTEKEINIESQRLTYLDARDSFWLPQVTIGASSSADLSIGRIGGPTSTSTLAGPSYGGSTTPSSLDLTLGRYALYNFGRDKLAYDSARETWLRAQDSLQDVRRTIRFDVIVRYWTLAAWQKKIQAMDRSIEVTRAIRDLKASRALVGRATEAEVASAESDLLNVSNLRESTESSYRSALFDLNVLLGDAAGTEYVLAEKLGHLPIKVTEEVLFETYLEKSPAMKAARTDLRKAEIALELEKRTVLPLPVVTFSGVTVSKFIDGWRPASDAFTQSRGDRNLNISAQLNFSIPLIGAGGLLNSRSIQRSALDLRASETLFRNTANRDRQRVAQISWRRPV